MVGDSSQPTRQHRSSADDAEVRSKPQKKHRDHRHRHRSKQEEGEIVAKYQEALEGKAIDEIEVAERNLESYAEVFAATEFLSPSCLKPAGEDLDMEEGEIMDDDGVENRNFEKVQKDVESDFDSGGIDKDGYDNSNTGVIEESLKKVDKNLRNSGEDIRDGKESIEMDWEKSSGVTGLPERDRADKYHKDNGFLDGDGKRKRNPDAEIEWKKNSSYLSSEKKHKTVAHPWSHDKYQKECSKTMEDLYHTGKKQRSELDDERIISEDRYYSHSSRYDARDKEKEHNYNRYTERAERNYRKETHDKYREGSRVRDWNRKREKENEEKKRDPERGTARIQENDWTEREMGKDRSTGRDKKWERERERDRDIVRDERNKVTYRGREGNRYGGRQAYDGEDGYGNRDSGFRHRRKSEELLRERSRRSDIGNVCSNYNPNGMDIREDDIQEDYQDRIVMQLAEKDEEDDLERIKEESRRRRQAILEKYKNLHEEQQNETQLNAKVKQQAGQTSVEVKSVEVIAGNIDDADSSFSVGKSPLQSGFSVFERPSGTGGLGDGTPKSERSVDMFCDDIFEESPAGVRKTSKGDGVAIETSHDNWDDAEGYYGYRLGEILDGRYEIVAAQGKGVFSIVVRAKDLKAKRGEPEEVAIKIIRSNETMYKAGMDELAILKKLVRSDPEDKRHCVRFLSTFKYRNHLCLVFESLHMNLREVLKKYGRNVGLRLSAVRAYAKQLFISLKHLKNCGVLHSDIKPDNMLVNEAKNVLKLCDFGNAMFTGNNEITPYLVSRFYRAPEIRLPYDHPMDMWSVGCCLFELCMGKVLFPGSTNNDMLRLHMELKGPFPKKMLRKGGFVDHHFDHDLNFLATEEDPVTKKAIRRLLVNIKPKDFGALILGSRGDDPNMLAKFRDLMEKIFVLDPEKRLNVSQALNHPFITGK
ncbi:serine/threonine-protein kinase prp4 homolog [Phtheirospermum japonicum]|uniref:non-specific serine/threonine protein kinase n=1 Tax=Phtheirospermum japonicum TaxID=374723 RepID=A0A830CBP5_9LAMI|nr:serine/threonine-protein kinase prp4 homolog [Phtheirospermum japonicum]